VKRLRTSIIVVAISLAASSVCMAQNVTGYSGMSEPLLFLLREPAVHADLELTAKQLSRLTQFNQSFDGKLLASRNIPAKESRSQVNEVLTETRKRLPQLLTSPQRGRLQQIKYRLYGIQFILQQQPAEHLGLDDAQKTEIEKIVQETQDTVQENSSSTFPGKKAYQEAQQVITAARKAEQKQILAALDESQKKLLSGLIGPSFDSSRLGRVSFKAPEFAQGDQWLNSDALQLEDLRGKVVALHFYAFG